MGLAASTWLTVLCLALSGVRAEPASSAPARPLDDLYQQAKTAYDSNQFEQCKRILNQATTKTPVMLVLLAQAECELEEYRACATHATESLRSRSHSPEKRRAIEAMRAEAAHEVGTLVLTSNVRDADVWIDDRRVGMTPLEGPIYVEPGSYRVAVEKIGYGRMTRRVLARRGMELGLDFDFPESMSDAVTYQGGTSRALVPQADEEVTPKSTTGRDRHGPHLGLLLGGGILAAGGLGTALYLNARASSDYGAADELKLSLAPNACAPGASTTPADCSELRRLLARGDRERNYAIASLSIGGAALIATVAYALWPRSKPVAAGGLTWTGALRADGAWVGVMDAF